MEVEAAGGFEDAVDFDDPQRHVDEIGEETPAPEHLFQPPDQLDRLFGPARFARARGQPLDVEDIVQPLDRLIAPVPRIDKGLRLRAVLAALVVVDLEVIALRIERRIDVAQIDAFRRDLAAQHVQIIAIIEFVLRQSPVPHR